MLKDVGEKFNQNNDLLFMLKATNPKLKVEATNDWLCGTGVPLHDIDVLN